MTENCPYCGIKLFETNWGRKFCANHGIIDEKTNSEENSDNSYIG